jgi:hypothetical protein
MADPMYTNTSRRAIHLPGGVLMVPGEPIPLSADMLDHPLIQIYLDRRDIEKGEIKLKSELDDENDPPPVKPPAPKPATK